MDPIKATLNKYKGMDLTQNLMDINNTCNEICVAFNQGNQFSKCRQDCAGLVRNITTDKYSFDYKDLQSPVIWNVNLHYLPELLEKGMSAEEAKTACLEKCKSSSDPAKCASNCKLDYDAVSKEGYTRGIDDPEESYCGCGSGCPCGGRCGMNCPCGCRTPPSQVHRMVPTRTNGSTRSTCGMWWFILLFLFIVITISVCKYK